MKGFPSFKQFRGFEGFDFLLVTSHFKGGSHFVFFTSIIKNKFCVMRDRLRNFKIEG